MRAGQRDRGPRGHRRTHQSVPETVSHVCRKHHCDAQPEQPTPEPAHRQRNQPPRPARLTVSPHESVRMLARCGRCNHHDAYDGDRGSSST